MLLRDVMVQSISQSFPIHWPWSILIGKWGQASILRRFLRNLSSACLLNPSSLGCLDGKLELTTQTLF